VDGIRKDGWLDAILLKPAPESEDAEYLISDGDHRWKAAKDELELDRVPALIAEDWDEADRRLLRQKMNKIHGEHDDQQDALEYDWLAEHGKRDEVLDLLEHAPQRPVLLEDLSADFAGIDVDGHGTSAGAATPGARRLQARPALDLDPVLDGADGPVHRRGARLLRRTGRRATKLTRPAGG
ncbi:MAG: ParB N-terminal domain-containing protein, partial [Polyangiales bacterium]